MKPAIITPEAGLHNADLERERSRLMRGQTYKDLSTICLTPTRGGLSLAPRIVQSWDGLLKAMNQKWVKWFLVGMEVGDAYSQAVDVILANADLAKWKYLLTLEDDNMPSPDGLLKLYEDIESGPWSAVGGLYWTKGWETSQPMCYGRPDVHPKNFIPWLPAPDSVTECNGLGMGFTLFKIEMFKDKRLPRPLFKTAQEYQPGQGVRCYTQDLNFFEKAGSIGYRFACSTRVLVGHYDADTDTVY